MNIDVNSKITTNTVSSTSTSKQQNEDSPNFADELSNLTIEKSQNEEKIEEVEVVKDAEDAEDAEETEETKDVVKKTEDANKTEEEPVEEAQDNIGYVIDGLEDAVAEMNDKLNQTDENEEADLKDDEVSADKNIKNEANTLINNDMNIPEQTDALMFQMNAGMNFNSDGQPFSDFMNNQDNNKLNSSAKDLAEEQAVLSTMDENIAIATKNRILTEAQDDKQAARVKTVINTEGIKKVDKDSNVTLETVVKYDSIMMNESDVDFFVQLVEKGQAEAVQATAKSSQISKALADLIAKSMKDNQPVRIDFDNNISVIIKIGKDGKISADFLPSSQVAEAYLKENLPLLKQRFDENNIAYDELNHRRQKQDNEQDENQKKGRNKDE